MSLINVAEEFKKNAQLKEEDLNHLKEWLSKQPHLPHVTGKYFFKTKINYILYYERN